MFQSEVGYSQKELRRIETPGSRPGTNMPKAYRNALMVGGADIRITPPKTQHEKRGGLKANLANMNKDSRTNFGVGQRRGTAPEINKPSMDGQSSMFGEKSKL